MVMVNALTDSGKEETMSAPDQVYLLGIAHRHGESLSVYTSHRAAMLALYAYVKYWWQEAVADDPRPLEGEPAAAIEAYFELALDESYEISAQPVRELETVLSEEFADVDGAWVWQPPAAAH